MSRRHMVTEEELRQHFRRAVQARRAALSLTMKEAAERAGLYPRHWQRIEAGQANVTIETMDKISRALGVDIVDLIRLPPRGR